MNDLQRLPIKINTHQIAMFVFGLIFKPVKWLLKALYRRTIGERQEANKEARIQLEVERLMGNRENKQ